MDYGIIDWRDYADPTLIVGDTIEQVRRDALKLIRTEWCDDGYFAEGGEGFPAPDPDTATDDEIRECLERMHTAEANGLALFTHAVPSRINTGAGLV